MILKTINEFAAEKKVSRQTVYNNLKELDFVKKFGKILLVDSEKNKEWKPKRK